MMQTAAKHAGRRVFVVGVGMTKVKSCFSERYEASQFWIFLILDFRVENINLRISIWKFVALGYWHL